MYFNGKGAPRDYDAAAQYFQQAADLGDGYSLKFLAIMYERGLLGKPDPAKASELRLKAAEVDPNSQDPVVSSPKTYAPVRRAGARHGRTCPRGQDQRRQSQRRRKRRRLPSSRQWRRRRLG